MSLLSRLLNLARTRRVDCELDDEHRFHLETRVEALLAEGLTREAAQAEAARRFGGRLRTREASRDIRLVPWLESLARDLRFAARLCRRDAVVSGAAVLSLALALGACAAAFSLVDALMLRPLPVRDPQRLVYLTFPSYFDAQPVGESFSYPVFERLKDAARSRLDLVLASRLQPRRARLPGSDDPREEFSVQFVSGDAFNVLGVRPALGRMIGPADDTFGGAPIAVLDHRYWVSRFGADPGVVGRVIALDDLHIEVVGVMEPRFSGIEPGRRPDVWLPASMYDRRSFTSNQWNWFRILGRLAPDVDSAAAQAVLQPAFTAFRREVAAGMPPDRPREAVRRFVETPLAIESAATGPSALRRELGRPLLVLFLVAGLVLLIAASNVANLLLARGAARAHELSLRLSLGASRARLIQQSLVESAVLTAVASVLALAVARVTGPVVVTLLAPAANPAFLDLRTDWRVLSFLVLIAALTTALFGLGPARRASRVAPMGALAAASGRATARAELWRPLVAVQIAFSLSVLFVAGLLLVSFARLARVDIGFNPERLVSIAVDAPQISDRLERVTVGLQLAERVRATPGVADASLSAWPLFSEGGWTSSVLIPGRPPDGHDSVHLSVYPHFFSTMGMRVVAGRDFEDRDVVNASPTAELPIVVNEAFARRYFGAEPAVGRIVQRRGDNRGGVTQRIVGVVQDTKYNDPREAAPTTVFVAVGGFGSLIVRLDRESPAIVDSVRRVVKATHPAIVVNSVTLQSTLVDNTMLRERLLALLSAFFAIAGLVLTAVGLYGVLSYSVIRRTREIGVRVALGAQRGTIIRSLVTEVATVTTAGVAAGLAGGVLLSRYVASLLFEVTPLDVSSLVLPVAALLLAAAAAAIVPAVRATRVDPVVALRAE
jgi:putative ABC transport system permease protein